MIEAQRRAALTIHALDPRDQRWLMERLPPPERARMSKLLGELRKLGIPRDPALLASFTGPPAPAAKTDTAQRPIPAARLAQILSGEPAPVVAALLLDYPEEERHDVLASLSRPKASAVRALLRSDLVAATPLRAALREAATRRAEHTPAAAEAVKAATGSRWSRLLRAISPSKRNGR